jgi:hypothetical protein
MSPKILWRVLAVGGVVVLILIILSVTLVSLGPPVGNIFSGTVSSLTGPGGYGGERDRSAGTANLPPLQAEDGRIQPVTWARGAGQAAQERVILRDATLRVVVADVQAQVTAITQMTEEMGGWVVNTNVYRSTTRYGTEALNATLSLRIPAERLDEALERIKTGAMSAESETVTGQDVTEDYVDVTSRLANLEAAEAQLQRIMESAETTEDVLAVYSELVDVRGEIESARGRLQYYDQAAAFSSVNVELLPEPEETPAEITAWDPTGTLGSAFHGLTRLLQLAVDLLIWVIVIGVPLGLIIGVPAWIVRRFLRRRGVQIGPPPQETGAASAPEERN